MTRRPLLGLGVCNAWKMAEECGSLPKVFLRTREAAKGDPRATTLCVLRLSLASHDVC